MRKIRVNEEGTIVYDSEGRLDKPKTMTDKELKWNAYIMYANWLETGDVNMGRNDAIAAGQHKKIKAQDEHQVQMVLRLRQLATELNS